jgi:hypothetical protein
MQYNVSYYNAYKQQSSSRPPWNPQMEDSQLAHSNVYNLGAHCASCMHIYY